MRTYLAALILNLLASSLSSGSLPYIRVIQFSSPLTWCISGRSMVDMYWTFSYSSIASLGKAAFAKMSASMFSSLGSWTKLASLNFLTSCFTVLRYYFIRSSSASHVPFTWLIINYESPWTTTDSAPKDLANSNPLRRASYSASLLVVWYCRWAAFFNLSSSGELNIIPIHPAYNMDEPSTLTTHL